jgi:SAM-dependent methyltransferase
MIDPEREEAELRAYLGTAFDRGRLENHAAELEAEFARIGDEQQLYRTSTAYLYDLTAFAMSRTKEPYLRELMALVARPARVLDWGCGIGSDGLVLLERGYDVSFADFDNPSIRYLRWRLEHRGLRGDVHTLEAAPAGFDAAFCFDVVEHVDDPYAVLAALESRARLVMVNFLEPVPGETRLHRQLPVADLVGHAARQGLRSYRVHHGRSHLVAYKPGRCGPLAALRSRRVLTGAKARRTA